MRVWAELPAAPLAEPQPQLQGQPAARETRIPVKGVRKATAQAMVASAFTARVCRAPGFLIACASSRTRLRQVRWAGQVWRSSEP